MYNSDGTLRVKAHRKQQQQSSLNLGWGGEASKENCSAASNSPTASPKAAGVRSKITSIKGSESPLKAKGRPYRHQTAARSTRRGSEMRAQQNRGTLSFKDTDPDQKGATSRGANGEPRHRGVSDAKRRALYESSIFGGKEAAQPPSNELSQLKLHEVTGHGIFDHEQPPEDPKRAVLGGVRKDPGGGSSLSMKDLHPGTPAEGKAPAPASTRHPGGKSSFGFGW